MPVPPPNSRRRPPLPSPSPTRRALQRRDCVARISGGPSLQEGGGGTREGRGWFAATLPPVFLAFPPPPRPASLPSPPGPTRACSCPREGAGGRDGGRGGTDGAAGQGARAGRRDFWPPFAGRLHAVSRPSRALVSPKTASACQALADEGSGGENAGGGGGGEGSGGQGCERQPFSPQGRPPDLGPPPRAPAPAPPPLGTSVRAQATLG